MKLLKFRIWNYKSIIDSGDCYPASAVTIFAGKNEAGKSSILEALEDFNDSVNIRDKALPIGNSGSKPKIAVWFEVLKEDLEQIADDISFTFKEKIEEKNTICISKSYPDIYEIEDGFADKNGLIKRQDYAEEIKRTYSEINTPINKEISNSTGVAIPELTLHDLEKMQKQFTSYQTHLNANIGIWAPDIGGVIQKNVEDILHYLKSSNEQSPLEAFTLEFLDYLPNFILFSSFDDVFPNTIQLSELKSNKWILDLAAMSDLDVATITGANDREKIKHKQNLNAKINSDFSQFWSQDFSKLVIEWDNEKLSFWIEENGEYYQPEIRSQGRRWHLAFYIRVSARARENVRNIILIDEPGLYLHANAQRDILKNLEQAGEGTQVFFSTHSPYLIEAEKLDRIRLVMKTDQDGTKVENKLHKVGDKETLTPILTAIGLEMNRGIASDKKNNIVVEGPSDYFYLTAFKRILGLEDLHFISGGSSGNMPKIGTILQGWGCKVVYLYDNDKAYKDATANIKRQWLAITKEVITKIPVDGAIEDMFTKEDFAKHIAETPVEHVGGKNSDYSKDKDKVLQAKRFLDAVTVKPGLVLSEETRENFTKLMKHLEEKIIAA